MEAYTKLLNALITDKSLSAIEFRAIAYFYSRMRGNGQPWEARADDLQKTLGIGRDAAKKAIASLKRKGYLADGERHRDWNGKYTRTSAKVVEAMRPYVIAGETRDGKPVPGLPPSNQLPNNEGSTANDSRSFAGHGSSSNSSSSDNEGQENESPSSGIPQGSMPSSGHIHKTPENADTAPTECPEHGQTTYAECATCKARDMAMVARYIASRK